MARSLSGLRTPGIFNVFIYIYRLIERRFPEAIAIPTGIDDAYSSYRKRLTYVVALPSRSDAVVAPPSRTA
jgi:hypothetical protein